MERDGGRGWGNGGQAGGKWHLWIGSWGVNMIWGYVVRKSIMYGYHLQYSGVYFQPFSILSPRVLTMGRFLIICCI